MRLNNNPSFEFTRTFDEPGSFSAIARINKTRLDGTTPLEPLHTDLINFTVVEAALNGSFPDFPFSGGEGLLNLQPFDVVLLETTSDRQSNVVQFGAVQGNISLGELDDVTLRVTAKALTDDVERLTPQFPRGPIELVAELELPSTNVIVDSQKGRSFGFDLEELFRQSLGNNENPVAALPRLLDSGLTFELFRDGELIDQVVLTQDTLRTQFVLAFDEQRNVFGEFKPLDIDIVAESAFVETFPTAFGFSVVATNVLKNLGTPGGTATLTIDYGDGSQAEVKSINLDLQQDGGDLNAQLQGPFPQTLVQELVVGDLHQYQSPGTFRISASLVLPTGDVAVDQFEVTVVENGPTFFEFEPEDITTEHVGPREQILKLSDFIPGGQPNEEVEMHVIIGDQASTFSASKFSASLDANRVFDVTVPDINLHDFIADDERTRTVTGHVIVSGAGFGPTIAEFEVTAENQAIEFVSFTKRSSSSSPLNFLAIGDEFDLVVPIRDNGASGGPITFESRFTVTGTTVNNVIGDAITNKPPEITAAISRDRAVINGGGTFEIRSFLVDPSSGERTLLDTLSIPGSTLNQPHVVLRGDLEALEGTTDQTLFPFLIDIFNVNGDAEVFVDFGNGRTETFDVTFFSGLGDNVNIQFSTVIANNPYPDDKDGTPSDETFPVRVEVRQNRNVIAFTEEQVLIRDSGQAALSLGATASSTTRGGEYKPIIASGADGILVDQNITMSVEVDDLSAEDDLTITVFWEDGNFDQLDISAESHADGPTTATLSHVYSETFLRNAANEQRGFDAFIRPLVVLTDDDGFRVEQVVEIPVAVPHVIEVPEENAAALAHTAVAGLEVPARHVTVGEDLDIAIRFSDATAALIRGLESGESFELIVRQFGSTDFLKLVYQGGQSGAEVFQLEAPNGTLSGRYPFRNEQPQEFVTAPTLRLTDLDTGEPLVVFEREGLTGLEVFNTIENGTNNYASVAVSVLPQLADFAVGANGSVSGKITGLGLASVVRLLTPDGVATEPLPSTVVGLTSEVEFSDQLPGAAFNGGVVIVEVAQQLGGAEVVRIPVTLTPPVLARLDVQAPDRVARDQVFEFTIGLDNETANRLTNLAQGFELTLETSDGRILFINRAAGALTATPELLENDGTLVTMLDFDDQTNTIIVRDGPTDQAFFTYDDAGLFVINVFGEDAFGSEAVIVQERLPGVDVNVSAVNGRLQGTIDTNSDEPFDLTLGDQVVNVGIGQQQLVVGDDPQADFTLPENVAAGQKVTFGIDPSGSNRDAEFSTTVTVADPNNSAPEFVQEPVVAPDATNGEIANITLDIQDADFDTVVATVLDSRGNQRAQVQLVTGNGTVEAPALFPDDGQFIIELFDGFHRVFEVVDTADDPLDVSSDAGSIVVAEDSSEQSLGNFQVVAEAPLLDATVTATNGIVSDGATTATSIARSGLTVGELNAFLDGLVFTPNANFHGDANVQIATDDPNSDVGDLLDVPIQVTPINDLPEFTNPAVLAEGDGTATLSGDVLDVDSDSVVVTVQTPDGGSTLGQTTVTLQPGQAEPVNFDFDLPADIAQVRVQLDDEDGGVNTFNVTVENTDDAVDLEVTKFGSTSEVVAGTGMANLVYMVSVTNNGTVDATGVVIDDDLTIPSGVNVISVIPFSGTIAQTDEDVTWTIGDLAAGETTRLTMVLTVTESAAAGLDVISNTASVSALDQTDTDSSNDFAAMSTDVLAPPADVDLAVEKTESVDPVIAGNPLTHIATVTNNGATAATGIEITDVLDLPTGVSVNSATPSVGAFNAGIGVWSIDRLAPGASATLEVVLDVASSAATGDTIVNTATVTALDQTDTDSSNDSAIESTFIDREIDLEVVKTAEPDPVFAGSGPNNLVHIVTVTNNGPSDASGVEILDTPSLPSGVTLDSAVPSVGSFAAGGGIWNLGDLAAGDSATLTLTLTVGLNTVPGADVISNTAAVAAANEIDTDPSNDSDSEATTINPLELGVYLIDDPQNRGQQILLAVGDDDRNDIDLRKGGGTFFARVDGERLETPESNVSQIVIYGLGGRDVIAVGDDAPVGATIWGGDGDDLIFGTSNDDIIEGEAGNDRIYGRDGTDRIFGGVGNDLVFGGGNDDRIFGGDGNDRLFGDNGDDLLVGGNGNDFLYGRNENDVLIGGLGSDFIDGDGGDNLLVSGETIYDEDMANLDLIYGYWANTPGSVSNRIAGLQSGTGVPPLTPTEITDESAFDRLFADGGEDLFYATATDSVRERSEDTRVDL